MGMQWRSIWVSLVIFVTACMLNRLDISIRHFSVVLALVVLLLAPLPQVLIDEYGFTDPAAYVPQALLWNCQSPSPIWKLRLAHEV
jgi:hypothetical protein